MNSRSVSKALIAAPSAAAIADAAAILAAGGLVAFPTETVYGLGAQAYSGAAVARVFAAKDRPRINPLIVHVPDADGAGREAIFDARARAMADAFWPGPLTLVLPRHPQSKVSWAATAGLETMAIRVPAHDTAQALLRAIAQPIVAPSANASGAVSATTAEHVEESLGTKVAMILDGGPTLLGLESTIIACVSDGARLLRPGAIPRARIEALIGPLMIDAGDPAKPSAPGQLKSHYAPRAHLRLEAHSVHPGEALLAFGPNPIEGADTTLNLSPDADLQVAAANLFAMLRTLDSSGAKTIAVMPVPHEGLGEAINDRLARAAAPRGHAS